MISQLLTTGQIDQEKAIGIIRALEGSMCSNTAIMWWLKGFMVGAEKRICPEAEDFFVGYMGASV